MLRRPSAALYASLAGWKHGARRRVRRRSERGSDGRTGLSAGQWEGWTQRWRVGHPGFRYSAEQRVTKHLTAMRSNTASDQQCSDAVVKVPLSSNWDKKDSPNAGLGSESPHRHRLLQCFANSLPLLVGKTRQNGRLEVFDCLEY